MVIGYWLLLHVSRAHFRAPLPIDARRDDAAGIACALTTGEKTLDTDMLQGVSVPENTYRTARTRLHGDHHGLVGQESVGLSPEGLESLLQSFGDHLRQPEVQRT